MGNKKREVRIPHQKRKVMKLLEEWLSSEDVKSMADIDARLFNEIIEDHPQLALSFCEKLNG